MSESFPENATIIFNENSPSKLSVSSIRSEYEETAIIPRDSTPEREYYAQPPNDTMPPPALLNDKSLGSQESRYYLYPSSTPATHEKRVRFHPKQKIAKYLQYRRDNGLPEAPDEKAHQPPYLQNTPTQWMHSYYGHHHPKATHPMEPIPYYPPAAVLQAEHLFYQQGQPSPPQYPLPAITQQQMSHHMQPQMPPYPQQAHDQQQPPANNSPNAEFAYAAPAQPAAQQQSHQHDSNQIQPSQSTHTTALKQGDGVIHHE